MNVAVCGSFDGKELNVVEEFLKDGEFLREVEEDQEQEEANDP